MIGRLFWGSLAVVLVGGTACSGKYEGPTETVTTPTETDFAYVSEVLDYSCGNLACHGALGRNLRLYGTYGRRLDPSDVACDQLTTAAEVQANYRSAVALEPELTAEVVASGGKDPERLTLVRKANGTESHKGGAVLAVGSFGDLCLRSWFTGTVDIPNCNTFFSRTPKVTCVPVTQ